MFLNIPSCFLRVFNYHHWPLFSSSQRVLGVWLEEWCSLALNPEVCPSPLCSLGQPTVPSSCFSVTLSNRVHLRKPKKDTTLQFKCWALRFCFPQGPSLKPHTMDSGFCFVLFFRNHLWAQNWIMTHKHNHMTLPVLVQPFLVAWCPVPPIFPSIPHMSYNHIDIPELDMTVICNSSNGGGWHKRI